MNEVAEHFGTRENQDEGTEFGMWVFLATEVMFFGPLLISYCRLRSEPPVFCSAVRCWCTCPRPPSSALLFLALKGYEYHDDLDENLVPWLGFHFPAPYRSAAALFYYIYYALTALHAFHLSIAVCVVAVYLWRIARAPPGPQGIARFRQQIAIAGLYWHFVDGMWVLLFTLIYVVGHR